MDTKKNAILYSKRINSISLLPLSLPHVLLFINHQEHVILTTWITIIHNILGPAGSHVNAYFQFVMQMHLVKGSKGAAAS